MAGLTLYRSDLKLLSGLRLREARALLSSGNQEGAYCLVGYAVECALKACIAKKTRRSEFPPHPARVREIYTHDLSVLLRAAGLEKQLEMDMRVDKPLAKNWNTVKAWTEESRYFSGGLNGRDLYGAVTGRNGVLRWIKRHW